MSLRIWNEKIAVMEMEPHKMKLLNVNWNKLATIGINDSIIVLKQRRTFKIS